MRILGAFVGGAAVVAIVGAIVIFGYTPTPFERSGEAATGQAQSNIGRTYTLDAATLTSTWTFTRDVDVVLRFDDGSLALDGTSLDAGCYSGKVTKGAVLTITEGRNIHFASPDSDSGCHRLP